MASRGKRGRRVRVMVDDIELTLRVPEAAGSIPVTSWHPFSPTEYRVLALLLSKKALSREEIAVELEESPEGRIKGVLATLVGRKVLLIGKTGYEINAPSEARKSLAEWVQERADTPDGE